MTPNEFSLRARLKSFVYAGRGIQTMLVSQHNAWLHAAATAIVMGSGIGFGIGRVEFRDRSVELGPGELVIVPHGVEHRLVAEEEAALLLFEPAATLNTGNVVHPELTAPLGVRI